MEGTLTNKPMPLRAHLQVRPGVVIHTDVAAMNVPSISKAMCFINFIDGGSEHVKLSTWSGRAKQLSRLSVKSVWLSDSPYAL